MSQNSVNIEEADICKCGDYCRLKTSRTPFEPRSSIFWMQSIKGNWLMLLF
ncbi:hypothetical protein KY285_026210 [Solanum tuberosum]|nr:hypothetical protein KY285_026210 [Solanum tuberosum]